MMNSTVYAAQPAKVSKAKSIYTENEFLDAFSGKSRKVVTEVLGKPVRKEQSVQPSNAAGMVAQAGASIIPSLTVWKCGITEIWLNTMQKIPTNQ